MVEELKKLEGANFVKFWKCENFYKIRFRKEWNIDIVISLPNLMFITKREFKCSADNFSMKIRKELSGSKLIKVTQLDFDRIVVMEFSRGSLIIELFSHGNIILTREGKILAALRREEWKDRTIKPGEIYKPPEHGLDPFEMSLEEFNSIFTEKDIVRSLVKNLKLGKRYIEKLISESGEDPNARRPKNAKKMFETLKTILSRFKPGIEDKPTLFQTRDGFKPTNSFNEALDEFYGDKLAERRVDNKLEKRLKNQEKALKEMEERAKRYKEIGDLIYKNMQYLDELVGKIKKMRKEGRGWKEIEKELGVEINEKTGKLRVNLD